MTLLQQQLAFERSRNAMIVRRHNAGHSVGQLMMQFSMDEKDIQQILDEEQLRRLSTDTKTYASVCNYAGTCTWAHPAPDQSAALLEQLDLAVREQRASASQVCIAVVTIPVNPDKYDCGNMGYPAKAYARACNRFGTCTWATPAPERAEILSSHLDLAVRRAAAKPPGHVYIAVITMPRVEHIEPSSVGYPGGRNARSK